MTEVTEQKQEAIKDSEGNPLEIGATYCCAVKDSEGETRYGELVVYAGIEKLRFITGEPCESPILLDPDSMGEVSADWDFLVRQSCPLRELESA